ncbi:AbgT family transporter [Marinitenerispora sediminis]|uniref:p-aminobenzoyl-glutamate transporter n=1 Tax=Marinitenerispora sediminis TaxID=1931232 RepID=A0A368TAB0_9ACTN|nr:AbgT family transporter [Marinitenerispora sediminis]RCV53405.1 p-aminobenzoyl-glutamate transporter [Marinitenerispora sediminis]RCV58447.1 p-aminobenzoyl-glutamate transporter [Marinitenerispora sediminis]RCV61828.1 p-aminobenzoyl-glutamate transporter [Marinitenerispora sediminis]
MALLLGGLNAIERVGNKLPHPFWLFTIMAGIVIALSVLLSALGVYAVSPADGERIGVRSLLSAEGLQTIVGDAITNFATFPPLALIIAVMLGVSVAERSGLLNALLRGSVTRVPASWLTFVLALTGVTGSVASDAAYVVLIPLGALVFKAAGRSPILGLVVAFTSISAGYDASLLITPTDAILAGLTTSAAHLIDPDYVVTPLSNYFFSAASTVFLAAVITVITEFVLSRRTAGMEVDGEGADAELGDMALSAAERRGLRNAGLVLLAAAAVLAAALVPSGSPFRGEDGTVLSSPVITGVAYVLGILFLLTGAVYGRAVGTIPALRDIPPAMATGVRDLAPVIVLFFAASQFLAYFKWTGLGEVMAIRGADVLGSAGVHPVVLFLGFLAVVAVMNLLITSGSAMWTLVGPIFVPMFMLLGIAPETTQALYRIADSTTNVISPMSPYFVMALGFLQRYRKDAGIGTLMSLTLPLSVAMLVAWTLFFLAWWALGIPLGPGVPVR